MTGMSVTITTARRLRILRGQVQAELECGEGSHGGQARATFVLPPATAVLTALASVTTPSASASPSVSSPLMAGISTVCFDRGQGEGGAAPGLSETRHRVPPSAF